MSIQAYHVPSSTDPRITYLITLDRDGLWQCSCLDYVYRRRECKHMRAVLAGQAAAVEGAETSTRVDTDPLFTARAAAFERVWTARTAVRS